MVIIQNVLSLFDGMSGAMAALQSIGIKPTNYFACEVDKYSEAVSRYHYPEIIRLGDVNKVNFFGLPKIDLLVAGFPCQSFSLAGKQLNFDDPRGKLFFEVIRLIEELQPTYFLLENVKMKKEIQDEISGLVGVQPIQINSALLSAQKRVRNYWTNILGVTQPEDKGIILMDIIEDGFVDRDKSYAVMTGVNNKASWNHYHHKRIHQIVKLGNINPSGRGMNGSIFGTNGKSPTLTTNKGEGIKISGAAIRGRGNTSRDLELNNSEKANSITTFRESSLVAIQQRARGFNKGGLHTDKSPTLSANSWQDNNHLTDGIYWRKLTPIECERLQTFPDDFTKFGIDANGKLFQVSNSQRFKMLGNGFTRDVIAHIASFIKYKQMRVAA